MYYEEFGCQNKKTIIFIHGAMWPRSLNKQESLADDYHTVFFQMKGHGKEFDSEFDRREIVDEIISFVKDNKIDKPHLVGFSLGTQIAMILLNDNSSLFDKIVLVSPLVDATSIDIAFIKFNMITLAGLAKIDPLCKIAANVFKIEEEQRQKFADEMKAQKVIKLADDIMSERLNMSDLPNFSDIKNNVFISYGKKDSECFKNTAKKLTKILKNSIIKSYNCGHNVPISKSTYFNHDLRNFFA